MEIIDMLTIFCGILVLFSIALLIALLKSTDRIIEVNKKLMILAMGREKNIEGLRALVASEKPPQKNLKGIATNKKENKKPENTNYTMSIGI